MMFDIGAHILPKEYKDALEKFNTDRFNLQDIIQTLPSMYDLDHRFRIMDKFNGLMHVITLSAPAVEEFADADKTPNLWGRLWGRSSHLHFMENDKPCPL